MNKRDRPLWWAVLILTMIAGGLATSGAAARKRAHRCESCNPATPWLLDVQQRAQALPW
jgi:hypothetical protein